MKKNTLFKMLLSTSITYSCTYSIAPALMNTMAYEAIARIPNVQGFMSSGGMFKKTLTKLMIWNYKEKPEDILGLKSCNITEEQLKAIYKKIVLTAHPDVGGKHDDFVKKQEAYNYLKYRLETDQSASNSHNTYSNSSKKNNSSEQINESKQINEEKIDDYSFRSTDDYKCSCKKAYEDFSFNVASPFNIASPLQMKLSQDYLDQYYFKHYRK
ncbi:J domain-containing protein [Candidatus Dependentiae bacterium]|nr:J domain-containing protein [Candidatus Dependentiae bacterium]